MSLRRVAIVTGASSGIGRALAERAVRAGWDVFAVGRRAERLRELAGLVAAATGSLTTLAIDLREPGAAARIVRETLAAYGRIDVLVNNAGGVAVGPISEQSDNALYEQLETHVIVPLALTREALPSLRSSGGVVIFFGSGVARIPVGTLGAYPAAKAAVRSLSRTARNELRPAGIAVTYVDPGAVATEFMTRAGFAGPPAAIAASPYDVARAVFAAFTTRQPIVNAVPWQTFFVALGEAFPKVTDYLLSRAPGLVGGESQTSFSAEKLVLETIAPSAETLEEDDATPAELSAIGEAERSAHEATPEHTEAELHEPASEEKPDRLELSPLDRELPFSQTDSTIPPADDDQAAEIFAPEMPDLTDAEKVAIAVAMAVGERAQSANILTEGESFDVGTAPIHEHFEAPTIDATPELVIENAPTNEAAPHEAHALSEPAAYPDAKSMDDDELGTSGEIVPTTFSTTLEPHVSRMKKLNLREGFVRGLLVPGTELELGYVAMRWAGMPNKNERALTSEVLDALASAGYLERIGAERFLVRREAEA